MGEDLTKIAVLLVGVALVALLIGHAGGTAQVIAAGTSGFNQLLRTVTLQNPFGGGFSMGSLSLPSLNTGLYSSGGLIQ
jgi:hypothetical protein